MRVRTFELRLIAAGLTALWAVMAGLVLFGYRPGGPIDLLVGVAAVPPALIAAGALVWPPTARHDRVFAGTVWLGLLVGLLLIPSIGGVVGQLTARGAQTILPSMEAAYPWLLALAGTSLFAGLGIARRSLGAGAPRSRRLTRGVVIAAMLTMAVGSTFAGVAVANELALREQPAVASRFGPTNPALVVPECDGPIVAGTTAVVQMDMSAAVDLRPAGSVHLLGLRSGSDVHWTADVATNRVLGQFGAVRAVQLGWLKNPGTGWVLVTPSRIDTLTVDRQAVELMMTPGNRVAAEDRGIEFVEGARARHCRISIDGPTFHAAFPQVSWFAAGEPALTHWRGELDFWVFGDREVGRLAATVNGDAAALGESGLQATIQVTMIATDRDRPIAIAAPAGQP
jgi:hypothetical protein